MKKLLIGALGLVAIVPFISFAAPQNVDCSLSIAPVTVPLNVPTPVTVSWNTTKANSLVFFGDVTSNPLFTPTGSKTFTVSHSTYFQAVAIGNNGEAHVCTAFIMSDFHGK